ncbi:Serine/arginine repetitive matrix protein 2 [Dermatophagoides farinae]|uniref:Serine/arginine repetitive matrix protein 2 n=1 Tax=Dermatophagoides farinae TaxID=6954 RepID=A0A922I1U0_DERFA|nr:Serine/arginine repetitive matrix protein 2 [Dermatophagoides farinae]
MYNGIGLQTARGSGTNGYVQRNLSFVHVSKPKIDYKTEEEIRRFESEYLKAPNREILEHHRKRKIEVQCLELEEKLEKKGLSEDEIQKRVDEYRQELQKKMLKALENRQEFIEEILNSKGTEPRILSKIRIF